MNEWLQTNRYHRDPNVKLWEEGSVPIDVGRYQKLVGKLIYLSHIWHDIAFLVSVKSTSRYCSRVGNLVTWRSKNTKWLLKVMQRLNLEVLKELKMIVELSLELYCDSKATINIAYNRVQHDKTNHIKIDHHFIK
ncbi:hypothetical protein CR513_16610, partial [Mucuna pruriens]